MTKTQMEGDVMRQYFFARRLNARANPRLQPK